ncbi:hypothetical protein F5Y15DRAFT_85459 [Xylariaceae sp. FL0016]|nr:hypothetical protein F5Y15DRAFT_85459 [Xylariaceae sp. FL0016]
MKLSVALCALTLSSCTLGAPMLLILEKATSALQSTSQAKQNIKLPFKLPSRVSAANTLTLSHDKSNIVLPFSDSSLMVEETRASRIEPEQQPATIVDEETRAASEGYPRKHCKSLSEALRDQRVQRYAGISVAGLVLSFVAVLVLIELWAPIRQRVCRLRSSRGAIYLRDDEAKPNVAHFDMKQAPTIIDEKTAEL